MLCGVRMQSLKHASNAVRFGITTSRPTIGNYIIESLLDKNIKVAFGYNKVGPYSPIYQYADCYEDFNIVFEKYEKNCGFRALKYGVNTNKVINDSNKKKTRGNYFGVFDVINKNSNIVTKLLSLLRKNKLIHNQPLELENHVQNLQV